MQQRVSLAARLVLRRAFFVWMSLFPLSIHNTRMDMQDLVLKIWRQLSLSGPVRSRTT